MKSSATIAGAKTPTRSPSASVYLRCVISFLRHRHEDGFGNHHVDAIVAVDEFGDVEVGGDAREHVGVVAGEMKVRSPFRWPFRVASYPRVLRGRRILRR